MKGLKFYALALSAGMLMSSCGGNLNNTGKGSLIGAGGGAALGTLIGTLAANKKGKGAGIGAAVGVAVGTGVGALIGKKMDKAKAAAQQVENAQVESVTDSNGLEAVKVTFDSGILFTTGSATLSSAATSSLAKFASTVLNVNKDMDVAIKGYTDNQGWKNSTAAESSQKNVVLSQQRAGAVSNFLISCGVSSSQIASVEGLGEADPVADNSTTAGQEQNRRVEVYLYASKQMIEEAQAASK
ncbi:MAG: OmpA family protein [Paraprevotella sp.]|nr:OmpA family protein [Paraprevotella sp.]